MSKHCQTLIENIRQHQTTSDTATHDVGHSRRTVKHDERGTKNEEQWMTTATRRDKHRKTEKHTEQQSTAQWSKISAGLENGLTLKNAAQIFRATTENRASNTQRATHTAHSKHSKHFYALFLRFANNNSRAAQQTAYRAFYSVVFALSVWLFDYGNAAHSGKYI